MQLGRKRICMEVETFEQKEGFILTVLTFNLERIKRIGSKGMSLDVDSFQVGPFNDLDIHRLPRRGPRSSLSDGPQNRVQSWRNGRGAGEVHVARMLCSVEAIASNKKLRT